MKTQKYDGSDARKILAGMILDKIVCARVASQWSPEGLFDSDWMNLVGGLVVRHYKKFGENPNGQMTAIFESWANETPVEEKKVESVESFMRALSNETPETIEKSDFLLDLAGRYFNKVRMEKEIERIQRDLEVWRIEDAQEKFAALRKVQLGLGSFCEPAKDFDIWRQALDKVERRRSLVSYDGAMGEFIGDVFQPGTLFSFMAPEKGGKTTFIVDFLYRAIRARNRVAFFDTGDGDQDELILRLACRASRAAEYATRCEIPSGWKDDGSLITEIEDIPQVEVGDAYRKFRRVSKAENALRVSCHPSSTINVGVIDALLEDWAQEGWRADIVVIDYADILAPPSGFRDPLEQIDETWKQLRRLSQARHCMVMTATQASSASYSETGLLSRKHFSGRKTKLAHPNGVIGLNVFEKNREQGITILNWVVRRKFRTTKRFVTTAGCFAFGAPVLISR